MKIKIKYRSGIVNTIDVKSVEITNYDVIMTYDAGIKFGHKLKKGETFELTR
jgi:hypothetical protein